MIPCYWNLKRCDSNYPRMPIMPIGRKPGKPLSWVDTGLSLVLRQDGYVRYGMMRYVKWQFCLLVEA